MKDNSIEVVRAQYAVNELELRYLLWLRHGHDGLYGDDGEMQCGRCRMDFLRDSVSEIRASFERQGLERLRQEREGEAQKREYEREMQKKRES